MPQTYVRDDVVAVALVVVEQVDGAGGFEHRLDEAQAQEDFRKQMELFRPGANSTKILNLSVFSAALYHNFLPLYAKGLQPMTTFRTG